MLQRIFDIILSTIALIVFSPILLFVMFILKITGEREVFFQQIRVGRNGKFFYLYKFATMLKNSPNIGSGTITIYDDPRILPFGKVLRKAKINELPQLINVLKGDMSIIGPRPQTQRCFDSYTKSAQLEIIKVRPGLSGIGSITFRDEVEMLREHVNSDKFYDEIIMPYKGQLEEWYVQNNSIFIYFTLIIMTIYVVFFSSPRFLYYIFKSLPRTPKALQKYIPGGLHE